MAQPSWLCWGVLAACWPVDPGGLGMKQDEPGWGVCSIKNSVLPALAKQVHQQDYCPSSWQPCESRMILHSTTSMGKFHIFSGPILTLSRLQPQQFFLKHHYPKHLTMNCPNTTVCGAAIRRNPTGLHEEPAQTLRSNVPNTQCKPAPTPLRQADALKPLTFQKTFKIFFPLTGIILAVSVICAITHCFMGHSML